MIGLRSADCIKPRAWGVKAIARRLGVARNTVRAALRSDAPPRYERPSQGSIVDEVEPEIRRLLRDTPKMPATVIAERIGWTRGMTALRKLAGSEGCRRVAGVLPVWRLQRQPAGGPCGD